MALKKVECVIKDCIFNEEMPKGTDDITLGLILHFEITKSDEDYEIGLPFYCKFSIDEFVEFTEFPRSINSKELYKIVKTLADSDGKFNAILDPDEEEVSPKTLMLKEIPDISNANTQFAFRKKNTQPINKSKQFKLQEITDEPE